MSYITLEDTNTYLNRSLPVRDAWIALDNPTKEALIQGAFQTLENQVWVGKKVQTFQPFAFPRDISDYFDQALFGDLPVALQTMIEQTNMLVPDYIQKAQCELIVAYLVEQPNRSLIDLAAINVADFSLGEMAFTFNKPKTPSVPLPMNAWQFARYWHNDFWNHPKPEIRRG